jgi:DNA-binding beta-propeller fold protein YncE
MFKPIVESLMQEFDARGQIDRTPLSLKLEKTGLPDTVLSFPGKVLADAAEGRIFISDTNHHRIIITEIESGHVLHIIGRGKAGFADGDMLTASFAYPQGLALSADGATLYVADTGNHAVRRVDLMTDTVTTLVGTGKQARYHPPRDGIAPNVALNSPWDLALDGSQLYIAMAGAHQIWGMDLPGGFVGPLVGSGREGTLGGALKKAELAQPSGLALDGAGRLYFADSEGSSIRWSSTTPAGGGVGTLAGGGFSLFDFGDVDGTGNAARLQHPLGVVFHQGMLYVADTYNSKIKRIDPQTGEVTTLFGGGHGWRDGSDPLFYEPGGIDAANNKLYIADTNNHAIRIADLSSGRVSTLILRDMQFYMVHTNGTGETTEAQRATETEEVLGRFVHFPPIRMGAGSGKIIFHLALPEGYVINNLVSHNIEWYLEPTSDKTNPQQLATSYALHRGLNLPLEIHSIPLTAGEHRLYGHLTIFYCEENRHGICLVEQLKVTAPLIVTDEGAQVAELHYALGSPEQTNAVSL